jgi:hypothetical protein
MIPTLGDYTLDQWRAAVVEKQRYDNGRWRRSILIHGTADTFESASLLTAALDTLAAATLAPEPVLLRLRPGRAVAVRLRGFEKTCHDDAIAGAFTLELEGLTPWEESDVPATHEVQVTASGVVCDIACSGSLPVPLSLTFTATGMVLLPAFSDGVNTLAYAGVLQIGDILEVDSVSRKVFLNGDDVSSQATGDFLLLRPQTTQIGFQADPEGEHTGTLTLTWRERWL